MRKYWSVFIVGIAGIIIAATPYLPYIKDFWNGMGNLAIVAEKLTVCLGVLFSILGVVITIQLTNANLDLEETGNKIINNLSKSIQVKNISSDEFYVQFLAQARLAKDQVCISYLAPFPPDVLGRSDRTKYYKDMSKLIKSKTNSVTFRRLVRWSENNRKWIAENLKEMQKVASYELAVIDDTDDKIDMPLALSVQIVDASYSWIVAGKNHEQKGAYRDLFVQSEEYATYIQNYFDRLWERSSLLQSSSSGITAEGKALLNGKFRMKELE